MPVQGPLWGDGGYIRLVRNLPGMPFGQCGLAMQASFPIKKTPNPPVPAPTPPRPKPPAPPAPVACDSTGTAACPAGAPPSCPHYARACHDRPWAARTTPSRAGWPGAAALRSPGCLCSSKPALTRLPS